MTPKQAVSATPGRTVSLESEDMVIIETAMLSLDRCEGRDTTHVQNFKPNSGAWSWQGLCILPDPQVDMLLLAGTEHQPMSWSCQAGNQQR